jgi:hypothetical protein
MNTFKVGKPPRISEIQRNNDNTELDRHSVLF